ncbi:MAG: hypothetical protein LBH16_12110 [Treponema sp.]|jgi:hypothetical protein|nr:hypothetical protein [Treponema sp.]
MSKKRASALLLGIFLVLNAEASMVSFYVIETGLSQEGPRNVHSERWENALFEVFFDAGAIVSNTPMLRLDFLPSRDEIEDIASKDMDEAESTGSDYFIITQLNYSGAAAPYEIWFIVFTISPNKKIYEQKINGKTYISVKDENDDLKKIVKGLVPHLNKR